MSRNSLSLSVVIVIALVGGLILYEVSDPELDLNTDDSVNKDRTEISTDNLGLMNISRTLLTGLKQIVVDEGTGLDVIDLVDRTEVQLNETIKDVDLSGDQLLLVENLYGTLDKMKDLAESGASPAQISETLRPNKRIS